MRQDVGALWENYLISERIKLAAYNGIYSNRFFWRTKLQQEVDYVEEREGKMWAYEFKFNPSKSAFLSRTFISNYPENNFQLINSENYSEFLLQK
jgi:hypothetical protein